MIKIESFTQFSCQGPRDNQEDHLRPNEHDRLSPQELKRNRVFVVCDGMGGHGHGEVASREVGDTVYNYLTALHPSEYTPEHLQAAVDLAVEQLAAANTYDDEKPMGTTLIVAVVNANTLLVGHVGDSRAYVFDENGFRRFRTRDHSRVQEAVEAEILTEEEAFNSPYRNIITRSISAGGKAVEVEVDTLRIHHGDQLLICTDGVCDTLRDADLEKLMMAPDDDECLDGIREVCNEASSDNHTAMLLRFSQDEPEEETEDDQPDDESNARSCAPDGESSDRSCALDGESNDRSCAQCGHHLLPEARFCPNCGRAVDNGPHEAFQPTPQPRKKTAHDASFIDKFRAMFGKNRHEISGGEEDVQL